MDWKKKKLTDIGLGLHPDMDFKKLTGRFSGHWID